MTLYMLIMRRAALVKDARYVLVPVLIKQRGAVKSYQYRMFYDDGLCRC